MGDSRRHIFAYIQVGASDRNKAGIIIIYKWYLLLMMC